jgi:F-type H+-transporting ATPase subunit gamma
MKRPLEIAKDLQQISTIVNLTGVFEGIASLRIAQIKNQVLQSQDFFQDLWNIYNQIRVDGEFRFGRSQNDAKVIDKELFIVITAEGGFSGDIDLKLIDWMLKSYDKDKHDIVVIGHHGAIQLAQRGVKIKKYYKLPSKDQNINVAPIIAEVQQYKNTSAWYQTYVSLMLQDVKRISLRAAVQQQGETAEAEDESKEIISEENYIFEPTTYHVIDHLERSMLSIALSQIILESKLAQYASRFRAMTAANDKAKDNEDEVKLDFYRAKRSQQDQRLKEVMAGLRKLHA